MAIDLPGQEVLGYKVVSLIGEGGMASVWRGEHTMLRKTVAITVLDPLLARDTDLVKRFIEESRAFAQALRQQTPSKVLY
jgi:serine/threonine protein kinase